MDISDTLTPTSDQLDAVDLAHSGPRTFTIKSVSKGKAEQPVQIALEEFPRVWRPGKSMRRVLAACWGTDASKYVGRKVTLFCDPSVRFGGEAIGGTRISHMSHIDKTQRVPLIVTRGQTAMFTVKPLSEAESSTAPTGPTADDIAACTDLTELGDLWRNHPEQRKAIEARVAEIKAADTFPVDGA